MTRREMRMIILAEGSSFVPRWHMGVRASKRKPPSFKLRALWRQCQLDWCQLVPLQSDTVLYFLSRIQTPYDSQHFSEFMSVGHLWSYTGRNDLLRVASDAAHERNGCGYHQMVRVSSRGVGASRGKSLRRFIAVHHRWRKKERKRFTCGGGSGDDLRE